MYTNIDDSGRNVKLRKPRGCQWCGGRMAKGEVAVRRVYCWDGDFNDARMHPECYAAMERSAALSLGNVIEFLPGWQERGKEV